LSNFDYDLHIFRSPKFRGIVEEAIHFFNDTPVHSLPPPERFAGPGVYALYYTGNFELYAELGARNRISCEHPIYVGEAVARGSRKGITKSSADKTLLGRLRDHSKSIAQATNILIDDFCCRFMVMLDFESDLILPVESEIIRRYKPLWNIAVDGFGNHDPGRGRYNQAVSEWDALHPGRTWVDRLTGARPDPEKVEAKVRLLLL
jgi:Eco29kI restriction endonuclease